MDSRPTRQSTVVPSGPQSWLVLRTKPRGERSAVEHLAQRGVDPYCPMFLEPPWHRRAPRGPTPLFPGYVFARCRPDLRLDLIRFCPSVLAPLTFAGRLAELDGALVEELRRREGELGYIAAIEVARGIPKGGVVRIMGGPLRGLEGVFCGYLRGRERARILAEFLRDRLTVEVESDCLRLLRA